jgi:hypothetical protein
MVWTLAGGQTPVGYCVTGGTLRPLERHFKARMLNLWNDAALASRRPPLVHSVSTPGMPQLRKYSAIPW